MLFFLIALTLLSAAAHVAAAGLGGNWASLLVMWSPDVAAILVMRFSGRSLRTIGWRPGPVKWWALAWLLPPAYGLIWFTGLGDVPNPTFLERARFTLGMTEGSDALTSFYNDSSSGIGESIASAESVQVDTARE